MVVKICPRCQQRYVVDPHCEDFVHECNSGNATLDNEDVVVIGNWDDYTGSGIVNNALTQGTENELFGTRADIEGEDNEPVTNRGNRKSTTRTRQHLQFINLKGGN